MFNINDEMEWSKIRNPTDCYCNCSTTKRLFFPIADYSVRKGVRQGYTVSPQLFAAALQRIMKSLEWDERGIRVISKFLSNLCFADDIAIFREALPKQ